MNFANDVRAWARTSISAEIRLHLCILLLPGNAWEVLFLGEPKPSSHDHEPGEPPCSYCGWGE